MSIIIGYITPHPPILIPEIGGNSLLKIKATQKAMHEMAEKVASLNPDILVFISPHSPAFSDAIAVKTSPELKGSFAQFGEFSLKFNIENDLKMANLTIEEAVNLDIPMVDLGSERYKYLEELDHGVLVPLYYFRKKFEVPIVSLSISYLSYLKHYQLGIAVQRAAKKLNKKVAFIASGDLSHRLTPSAPIGYSPRGIDFDLKVKKIIEKGAFEELLKIDKALIEDAGECGLRSFITLGGVFDGWRTKSQVLSYEGPFGVGYMVAMVTPVEEDKEKSFLTKIMAEESARIKELRKKESNPVKLARSAVEHYIKKGKMLNPPNDLTKELLNKKAGVFISIKRGKTLRGCVGTTFPCQKNIAEEIIKNAAQAATSDPRFSPLTESELTNLTYSVDILNPSELIPDESYLNPKKYGVIVRSGFRTGLLLPDIEGIETAKKQVDIARQKACINPDEQVELFRFTVNRYK
ncbi:AmmeMemoRadiSam system protein A [Candidatus Oleimmundimicrobium sp.]|uniref:AmmeMemoRadiSam system protein A n=1 Tax=Candidatus Oleimmundimicrobium sp. TaxID=3060597 RepID=UPI002726AB7A|nr:AmmeMemoRadiSam system protein A [Candidatus Oleimmundimicrobium sp.]MDO8885423.1 AmmeMemoRadiSam system protein A [Candidatus Oleimmundimicrobium sp.]